MALSAEQVESFETNGFTLIDTPLDEEQLRQAERGWCIPSTPSPRPPFFPPAAAQGPRV